MDEKDLILSYDYFYHTTKIENAASIEKNGLRLNKYADFMYDKSAPEKLAQICLSPLSKVAEHKASFINASDSKQVAVFRVPADVIAEMRYGVDWTFVQTASICDPTDMVKTLKLSIEKLGTLCVFQNIPPDVIERIE